MEVLSPWNLPQSMLDLIPKAVRALVPLAVQTIMTGTLRINAGRKISHIG